MSYSISSVLDDPKRDVSQYFHLRDRIEQEIARSVSSFGERTKLRDAVEYALKSGGKRFRPLIVLLVAEALGHNLNVEPAALCVEFFHTASLIADDLPCMDDDDERRGHPAVHKIYGESIALLSTYALITAAFEKIHQNAELMRHSPPPFCHFSDRSCAIALELVSSHAGIRGATGGQFYDLFPQTITLDLVKQVIYKKTITLFEVSFVLGWVFGGGDHPRIAEVKKLAYHLGMAFQIADDLDDLDQDEKKHKEMSLVRFIGKERAFALFEDEMRKFNAKLKELDLDSPSFERMANMLVQNSKCKMQN